MKRIYCKPSAMTVNISKYCGFICTSTVEVKNKSYDGKTMTDLSRRSSFSGWSNDEE